MFTKKFLFIIAFTIIVLIVAKHYIYISVIQKIDMKNNVICKKECKIELIKTFLIKNVYFKGYTYLQNGIKFWYVKDDGKEHFLNIELPNSLINKIKAGEGKKCDIDIDHNIDFKNLEIKLSKEFQNLVCFETKKAILIYSDMNDKNLSNHLIFVLKLKRSSDTNTTSPK